MKRRDFLRAGAGISAATCTWLSPGCAVAADRGERQFTLGNASIRAAWCIEAGRFRALQLRDRQAERELTLSPDAFVLVLDDPDRQGRDEIPASLMRVLSGPRFETLYPRPEASRAAERFGGRAVGLELADVQGRVHARWRAVLRDGSHYIRQELTVRAAGRAAALAEIRLIDLHAPQARVCGTVRGSPLVAGIFFFGFEDPLSQSEAAADAGVRAYRSYSLPLQPGGQLHVSSVAGVARPGQLRRDFLRYVERERAHPYRPLLHYNSWYDIGYFDPYTAQQAEERIHAFGAALVRERGVKLDSFLFDDGWDDYSGTWAFNRRFPDGFAPLHEAARQYGAAPGCWLSPWGGYGSPRKERIERARALGYETDAGGLSLAGPRYYALFESVALAFIERYGVNQFKLDGTGSAGATVPGSRFNSDFDAAIHLIDACRRAEPNLYVNLTTGTYASPFWLRYADSIWRGGYDHHFTGSGSWRQRWITYRDAQTYRNVVLGGPLFPLNSVMLHGLIYAQHAKHLRDDPDGEFADEVRSYFGTGTQLQELYVTPELLSAENWDEIARCARWARANAQILRDTHWIGGDPAQGQIYGHAAWYPRGGVLSLRNPAGRAGSIEVDVEAAFELPPGAATRYRTRAPWEQRALNPPEELLAGRPVRLALGPYEVLTLDCRPA